MSNKKIYHYTVAGLLPSIREDKEIKCATANIYKRGKPAAWFSTNPNWEESANKMYMLNGKVHIGNKETTALYGKGLARIEVMEDAAPYTCEDFKLMSGIPQYLIPTLEKGFKNIKGDPNEWRCSFEPVPVSKWLSIEIFDHRTQTWKDAEEAINEDH